MPTPFGEWRALFEPVAIHEVPLVLSHFDFGSVHDKTPKLLAPFDAIEGNSRYAQAGPGDFVGPNDREWKLVDRKTATR